MYNLVADLIAMRLHPLHRLNGVVGLAKEPDGIDSRDRHPSEMVRPGQPHLHLEGGVEHDRHPAPTFEGFQQFPDSGIGVARFGCPGGSVYVRDRPKQMFFIFDGGVAKLGGDARTTGKPPRWDASNNGVIHLIGLDRFGKGLESDTFRHGLLTHYLLRGLEDDADGTHDGAVTLGELIDFLNQKVPAAVESGVSVEQRPLIVPAAAGG